MNYLLNITNKVISEFNLINPILMITDIFNNQFIQNNSVGKSLTINYTDILTGSSSNFQLIFHSLTYPGLNKLTQQH